MTDFLCIVALTFCTPTSPITIPLHCDETGASLFAMGLSALSRSARPAANESSPMMCLQHVENKGSRIILHPALALKGITLGRNSSRSHIVLGSSSRLSRVHASVKLVNGHWTIEDLGSTNGLFVNDVKCKSCVLQLLDTVSFGDKMQKSTAFSYVFKDLPVAESTTQEANSDNASNESYLKSIIGRKKRQRSYSPSNDVVQGRMKRKDIFRELTCSVCLEPYVDPVTCQCSHSFCRLCIESCLALNGQCPVCRYLICQSPVPSLSLKNQILRCLSPREFDDYKQREEQIVAHQASTLRRTQKLQASILQAKEQGLRFINVYEMWRDRDVQIYRLGVRQYKPASWRIFMRAIGLTEQSLQERPVSDQRIAFVNLGGSMQDYNSYSPKMLREILWRFLMYGTPFPSS